MKISIVVAIVGACALMSCGQDVGTAHGTNDSTTNGDSTLDNVVATSDGEQHQANPALLALLSTVKPNDVQTIGTVKKARSQAGDTITIQGRVGGKRDPFIAGYAAMLLADDSVIEACDFTDDDDCGKPWDYCCVGKNSRIESMATVQAVDAESKVLSGNLQGLGGIQAGSFVIITGTVDAQSSDGNLIVNITKVFHDRERSIRKKSATGNDHKHDD